MQRANVAMTWQALGRNWVLIPEQQQGIIHFLGGAFIATAPNLAYRALLEHLATQGYIVIATPFASNFDHQAIAATTLQQFNWTLRQVRSSGLGEQCLPIYGLGHSLGCKIQLLIGSLFEVERAGNMLLAFNNYPARRSIPFLEGLLDQVSLATDLEVEFTPSPIQTLKLIQDQYAVEHNLLVKFRTDDL
ncbi:MAG: DUF1350 family protein, partial [Cyanobacteria bacterium P01_H01_bin.121]